MATLRSALSRMKRWLGSDEPPKGRGPGGWLNSDSYNRARAEGEFMRVRDSAGGSFS